MDHSSVARAAGKLMLVTWAGILVAGCGAGASSYYEKGLDLVVERQWEKAIAAFDAAIELDPRYAAAYAARCNALRVTGELDRALADCDKAIERIRRS